MVFCPPDSWLNWTLECWFLRRGENRSTQRKTSRSKGENQQQTQPTYGVVAGIWTRTTVVGGECSHHCAIPRSPNRSAQRKWLVALSIPVNSFKWGVAIFNLTLIICHLLGQEAFFIGSLTRDPSLICNTERFVYLFSRLSSAGPGC